MGQPEFIHSAVHDMKAVGSRAEDATERVVALNYHLGLISDTAMDSPRIFHGRRWTTHMYNGMKISNGFRVVEHKGLRK